MTLISIQKILEHPLGAAFAIAGLLLTLVKLWVATVKGLSITTKVFEEPRNKKALTKGRDYIASVIARNTAPTSVPPNAGVLTRCIYWFDLALACFLIAWFVIYATCMIVLAFAFIFKNSAITTTLTIAVAMVLFRIGYYFYNDAYSLRNSLIQRNKN
jgi:predicted membrane channel-forming protein YqfA (hemolysin III family)